MNKIILKASAGTGKTYRLSVEYIVSLLKGESYKNILVMTFTKKATSEIGQRIVEFLGILASKSDNQEIIEEKEKLKSSIRNLYPDLVIEEGKIFQIYKEISSNIDSLKIYTIDSFIGKIFKNVVAPSLGIDKYNIVDDDEDNEILIRLLEGIMSNKESFKIFQKFFLEHFEKDVSKYLDTLKEIIQSRWKYIVLKNSDINLEKEKIKKKEEFNCTIVLDTMVDLIKEVGRLKGKKEEELEKFIKSPFKLYLSCTGEEDKKEFYNNNLKIFLDNNLWDGRYFKSCKKVGNVYEDIFEELVELTEKIKKDVVIESYNDDLLNFKKTILEFIQKLYKEYDLLKLKEGKFNFNDISMYTFEYYREEKLNLVSKGEITEYFEEVFDGKFSTFFIDEFQDTSILQWQLLKGIAEKAENVLCVGDEKQSLYSWRGGEKELFENLSNIIKGKEKALDTCYRSKKIITDYINKLFLEISSLYSKLDKEIEEETQWKFTEVTSIKESDAYVEVINAETYLQIEEYPLEEETFQEKKEAKVIGKILKEKFNGVYKGSAVIARTGKELEAVAVELSNLNIPYTLKSKNNIFNHRTNIGIFKVLKFLAYDSFFSLLELLRTDLIMANGEELKWIIENKEFIMKYLNNEIESEVDQKYSNKIIELQKLALNSVIQCLKVLKRNYKSCDGKIENIILEVFSNFSGGNKYNSSTDLKNSYRFLEVSRMFNAVGELVMAADINPNNDIFAQVSIEEENAVILTTIHSSKGLEYETVFYIHNYNQGKENYLKPNFLLDLDKNFEKANNFAIFRHSHKEILDKFKAYTGDSQYEFIKKYKLKEAQEKINGWYVALTRAITNLFIIVDEEKLKDENLTENNLLNVALKNIERKVGNFVIPKETILKENTINLEEIEKIIDFLPLEIDEKTLEENRQKMISEFNAFSLETEEKKKIGTAVHFFCENINSLREEEKEKAREKTLLEYGHSIGFERLNRILESNELNQSLENYKEIFSEKWDKIFCEYEVINSEGQLRIIDRMMIKKHTEEKKGEVCIIDYKTGNVAEQVEKYNEQLQEYKKIIEEWLKFSGLEKFYDITTEIIEIRWGEK